MFARVFCETGTLAATVRFYEALTSARLDMDMDIPESGLHVVAVGPFLILEMDTQKLDRSGPAAQTHVTVLNADLDTSVAREVAAGAQIVQPRWEAPPARASACGTPTACWPSTSSTAPAPTTSASQDRSCANPRRAAR